MNGTRQDNGFSLIELLLVILILGILTSVVALSVSGMTGEAELTACEADRRALEKASEAYFAQTPAKAIPPASGDEPYEQTLVDARFLHQTSKYYDLHSDGQLLEVDGSPCTS